MASTNQSPFYQRAEKNFLEAETPEDKIKFLKEMIQECPKHKSAENMLRNLRIRYKKLLQQQEKAKKSGKSSRKGIKKHDMQAVIIGLTNTGKSSLLSALTNAKPTISEVKFTTKYPIIGMINHAGIQIQLIENPAVESENYNKGITNTADVLLIIITSLIQLDKILPLIKNSSAKQIIIYNNTNNQNTRKIQATLQSKKYDFIIVNLKTKENIEELKEKIFSGFDNIRVFTKEPGKPKSPKPIILKPNATVKDVAEKILHGFSKNIKETKIWGPSSKFSGQKVGLKHILKDLDVVEFKTR